MKMSSWPKTDFATFIFWNDIQSFLIHFSHTHFLSILYIFILFHNTKKLRNLGLVTMNFNYIYMMFTKEWLKHTLKRCTSSSLEIITSHCMEKLMKKGHICIIAQFNAIQVVDAPLRRFILTSSGPL
jgi:hypothetical protein